MNYAFFQGCNIPIRIEQYARATEAVLNRFDVHLQEVPEFNCCGYPIRNVDEKAYVIPSVRNLALAEKEGLDILVICNCCFASLQKARHVLANDPALQEEINGMLAKEGLRYTGKAQVRHYLTVLYEDIGVERISAQVSKQFKGLNISVIHGCHILRPREVTQFDDAFVPKITDELVTGTGAVSLDWTGKMECCGAALAGINDSVADTLLKQKVQGARAAGADFVTPICSYCHLQFDTAQQRLADQANPILPVLLYPQLLGLCLGIDAQTLGIACNQTITAQDLDRILALLGPKEEKKNKKSAKAQQKDKEAAAA
jgi:heterodisulfide reductase subunit B